MRESMGPPTLGLALKYYCKIQQNSSFTHEAPYHCHKGDAIQLSAPEAFYAIQAHESAKFVEPHIDDEMLQRLDSSYLSHIYFHTKHRVPQTSLYASLARQYCPSVYAEALSHDF